VVKDGDVTGVEVQEVDVLRCLTVVNLKAMDSQSLTPEVATGTGPAFQFEMHGAREFTQFRVSGRDQAQLTAGGKHRRDESSRVHTDDAA
jgi:hypothetical protein